MRLVDDVFFFFRGGGHCPIAGCFFPDKKKKKNRSGAKKEKARLQRLAKLLDDSSSSSSESEEEKVSFQRAFRLGAMGASRFERLAKRATPGDAALPAPEKPPPEPLAKVMPVKPKPKEEQGEKPSDDWKTKSNTWAFATSKPDASWNRPPKRSEREWPGGIWV